jgi:hypothetical protein
MPAQRAYVHARRFIDRLETNSDKSNSRLERGGEEGSECDEGVKEGGGDELKRTVRFRSRIGSPQPHLRHFCSICCLHISHQRSSSSARAFHR